MLNDNDILRKLYVFKNYSLEKIAKFINVKIPFLTYDKGYVGKLIEKFLYCINITNKKNKYKYDFPTWHLELKTVSVNVQGRVLRDICILSYKWSRLLNLLFFLKLLKYKLSKILWVTIFEKRFLQLSKRKLCNIYITYFKCSEINILLQEIYVIFEYMLNTDLLLTNYYSEHLRIQVYLSSKWNTMMIKDSVMSLKVLNKLDNYIVKIFLRKHFVNYFLNIFS